MKISPRVLLYGLIAVGLTVSSLLLRSSTAVAEVKCNNQPNHACTRANDNVNVSGGGVNPDTGRRCNFQPNHNCAINDNGPVGDNGNISRLGIDNINDNNGRNDNIFNDNNFNDNIDNVNDNVDQNSSG
jgi:hypothetical protein